MEEMEEDGVPPFHPTDINTTNSESENSPSMTDTHKSEPTETSPLSQPPPTNYNTDSDAKKDAVTDMD